MNTREKRKEIWKRHLNNIKKSDKENKMKSKEELKEILYRFNSQIVSWKWIGLKQKPLDSEISYLNKLLGECIKFLRSLEEQEK